MQKPEKKALFFHWGPGANSSVERLWFGNHLPINWWDQPIRFNNEIGAFSEVINAAQEELIRMAKEQGGPVPLIAHSFGAQIAIALSKRVPELIESITIMGASYFPALFPIEYCKRLIPHLKKTGEKEEAERLSISLVEAQKELNFKTFWTLVQSMFNYPHFIDLYWYSKTKQAQYDMLVPKSVPLNLDAFSSMYEAFIGNPRVIEPLVLSKEMSFRVIFGHDDPGQDLDQDTKDWKEFYPNVEITVLKSGHFIHLERPIEEWLPKNLLKKL